MEAGFNSLKERPPKTCNNAFVNLRETFHETLSNLRLVSLEIALLLYSVLIASVVALVERVVGSQVQSLALGLGGELIASAGHHLAGDTDVLGLLGDVG